MEQVSPTTPTTPSFAPNDVDGQVDYSQPVAILLRTSTARAHDAIHHSNAAARLLRGELPRDEYIYFMMMLWKVYSLIEDGLESYSTHPVLAPTYRPALLGRASRLSADIAYLMDTSEDGWRSSPLYLSIVSDPPNGLREYVKRLEKLNGSSNDTDHARLLSHAYVRYMGDLSGGQSIRNKMVKAYDLPETGAGASFFDFGSLDGSSAGGEKRASQAELLRIKEWYRAGMNEGVGDDQDMKAALIEEANIAFDLNRGLFQDVSFAAESSDTPTDILKPRVIFDASAQEEKTYPLSSVVAVVMAMATAHFILVVGGFTGSKGGEKLESFMLWLRSVAGVE
ncbi:heme oxygenase [Ceratobasidium sp. AG-Ba]|nr:heme oxygenase [Ceratobasidium sp. AG-Ba]